MKVNFNLLVTQDGERYVKGRAVNLSLGGMLASFSFGDFAVGTRVFVEVNDSNFAAPTLLIGRIRHRGEAGQVELGARFIGIEFEQLTNQVRHFLHLQTRFV